MLLSQRMAWSRLLLLAAPRFAASLLPYPAAGRPNILLIVSEDNDLEIGNYGKPYACTSNRDKLAAEGVRLGRASVPQAGSSPSRPTR